MPEPLDLSPLDLDRQPRPGEYTARVLPPEEWLHWSASGQLGPAPLPDPNFSLLIVVQDHTGRIVASWQALNTVHLEGLFIAEDQRHKGSVVRMLLAGMINALNQGRVPAVLTLAQETSIITLAQKFGFVIVPGTLLQLDLRKG